MMGVERNLGSGAFQWSSPPVVQKVQMGVIGSRVFHELVPEGRVAEAIKPPKVPGDERRTLFLLPFSYISQVCIMISRFCVWIKFYFDFYGRLFTILLILFRFPRILCCSGIKGRPEDSNGQVSSPPDSL